MFSLRRRRQDNSLPILEGLPHKSRYGFILHSEGGTGRSGENLVRRRSNLVIWIYFLALRTIKQSNSLPAGMGDPLLEVFEKRLDNQTGTKILAWVRELD